MPLYSTKVEKQDAPEKPKKTPVQRKKKLATLVEEAIDEVTSEATIVELPASSSPAAPNVKLEAPSSKKERTPAQLAAAEKARERAKRKREEIAEEKQRLEEEIVQKEAEIQEKKRLRSEKRKAAKEKKLEVIKTPEVQAHERIKEEVMTHFTEDVKEILKKPQPIQASMKELPVEDRRKARAKVSNQMEKMFEQVFGRPYCV